MSLWYRSTCHFIQYIIHHINSFYHLQDNRTLNKHDRIKWIIRRIHKYGTRWWSLSFDIFPTLSLGRFQSFFSAYLIFFNIFVPLFHASRSNAIQFFFFDMRSISQCTFQMLFDSKKPQNMRPLKFYFIMTLFICGVETVAECALRVLEFKFHTHQIENHLKNVEKNNRWPTLLLEHDERDDFRNKLKTYALLNEIQHLHCLRTSSLTFALVLNALTSTHLIDYKS